MPRSRHAQGHSLAWRSNTTRGGIRHLVCGSNGRHCALFGAPGASCRSHRMVRCLSAGLPSIARRAGWDSMRHDCLGLVVGAVDNGVSAPATRPFLADCSDWCCEAHAGNFQQPDSASARKVTMAAFGERLDVRRRMTRHKRSAAQGASDPVRNYRIDGFRLTALYAMYCSAHQDYGKSSERQRSSSRNPSGVLAADCRM